MKKEAVFLLGMVIIILGASFAISRIGRIIGCSESATATITDVVETEDNGIKYYPRVEFTAGDKTVRKTADVGSRSADRYEIGETLVVKYDPDRPEIFILEGFGSYVSLVGAAAVILAGIVLVTAGIGIARKSEGVPVFRA